MKTQNLNWKVMKQIWFRFDGKLERVNPKAPHYCEGQKLNNSLSFMKLGHERWSAQWCSSVPPPPLVFSSSMFESSLGGGTPLVLSKESSSNTLFNLFLHQWVAIDRLATSCNETVGGRGGYPSSSSSIDKFLFLFLLFPFFSPCPFKLKPVDCVSSKPSSNFFLQ